jgi:hypothetical protein
MSVRVMIFAALMSVGALTLAACVDAPAAHVPTYGYGTDYHPGGHD